jgi:hypothetical protein
VTAKSDTSSAPVNGIVTKVVAGTGSPVVDVTPEAPIQAAADEYTSACVIGAGPLENNFVAELVTATCPVETAIAISLSLS